LIVILRESRCKNWNKWWSSRNSHQKLWEDTCKVCY